MKNHFVSNKKNMNNIHAKQKCKDAEKSVFPLFIRSSPIGKDTLATLRKRRVGKSKSKEEERYPVSRALKGRRGKRPNYYGGKRKRPGFPTSSAEKKRENKPLSSRTQLQ